ncbi:MAG: hypothetical protein ACTSV7_13440, partial [Candidatus Baldrarchaeia archaeon]
MLLKEPEFKTVWVCPRCGWKRPEGWTGFKCPKCGAQLKKVVIIKGSAIDTEPSLDQPCEKALDGT